MTEIFGIISLKNIQPMQACKMNVKMNVIMMMNSYNKDLNNMLIKKD